MSNKILGSSFRDPSGFVFFNNNILYRQINKFYSQNYELLIKSGLYEELIQKNLLIPHREVELSRAFDGSIAYKVIQPNIVPFVSYPYEWSFSMLKDAALATLEIHKTALKHGMVLKDASMYNIQFINAKPVFIDTLSFEKYEEGSPWIAYQQFCKHLLAPLSLMSFVNIELGKLSKIYIDGIPLDLTSRLLPFKTRLNPGLLMHIHLHAQSQVRHANDAEKKGNNLEINRGLSKVGMLSIVDSLQTTIEKLTWKLPKTEWGDYYSITNYSDSAMDKKSKQVEELILATKANSVWDLGANTGRFSRLASKHNIFTVAFDIDPVAVELNYLSCKSNKEQNLLPLVMDLTNPSPDIGFSNNERDALLKRGPAGTVLALALIHHLAISNNLPFDKIAHFFAKCGEYLVIEFVPKTDSQVKILLASRKDIFNNYTPEGFKAAFGQIYDIEQERTIDNSDRTLYLMKRKKIP
jgi:hypothetical protein